MHASSLQNMLLLYGSYESNSDETNHYAVKLLHRIAFVLKNDSVLFKYGALVVFERVLRDETTKVERLKEVRAFAQSIVKRFMRAANERPLLLVEALFWRRSTGSDSLESDGALPLHATTTTANLSDGSDTEDWHFDSELLRDPSNPSNPSESNQPNQPQTHNWSEEQDSQLRDNLRLFVPFFSSSFFLLLFHRIRLY
jgi:hypothetical protein